MGTQSGEGDRSPKRKGTTSSDRVPSYVFLTGATGFIGSTLTRAWMARGVALHALVLPDEESDLPGGVGDAVAVKVAIERA